jgi:Leucine-rich repeat (LRR) protein
MSEAEIIQCEFNVYALKYGMPSRYTCVVRNSEIFNGDRVTIEAAEGAHESDKTDDDVNYIQIKSAPNMNYFPANLENVFNNLEYIGMEHSKLRHITKSDLSPFTELKFLDLGFNELKVLHSDLFENNLKLKHIGLSYNKIAHIGPSTFSQLSELQVLFLNNNPPCPNLESSGSRSGVEEIIASIENRECFIEEYE